MESSWSVEAEILLSRVCMLLLELPRWKSVRVRDILKPFEILSWFWDDLMRLRSSDHDNCSPWCTSQRWTEIVRVEISRMKI